MVEAPAASGCRASAATHLDGHARRVQPRLHVCCRQRHTSCVHPGRAKQAQRLFCKLSGCCGLAVCVGGLSAATKVAPHGAPNLALRSKWVISFLPQIFLNKVPMQGWLQGSTKVAAQARTAYVAQHPARTLGPVLQGSPPSNTTTTPSCSEKGSTPAALCSLHTRLRVK